MPRIQFTGFIGPSYTQHSRDVDAQRCVNLLPELNELGTGKNQEVAHLRATPGLKTFAVGDGNPSRGAHVTAGGRVFHVEGSKLYEVDAAGAKTLRGTLDALTGTVGIASSPIEVLFADGNRGYLLTLADNTFAAIADVDFPNGATAVLFLDGYFIAAKPASQRFYISSLLAGAAWDALDFSSKDGAPDNLRGLAAVNRDLMLLGERTTEIWINTGNPDFPFVRRDFIEYGIVSHHAVQLVSGALLGVAEDRNGHGIIGKLAGLNAVRVSTFPIEHALKSYGTDLSLTTAWSYQDGGKYFYAVNFPGAPTTWVLDVGTGLWHERMYLNGAQEARHRAEHHVFAFGKHLVSDYANGILYELDDTVGFTQETDPQAMLRWSDDGAATWSSEAWQSLGKIGEHDLRLLWSALGVTRNRVYELSGTHPGRSDNGSPMRWIRRAPHVAQQGHRAIHHAFELDAETGRGEIVLVSAFLDLERLAH